VEPAPASPNFQVSAKVVEVITELYRRLVAAERAFSVRMNPWREGVSHEAITEQEEVDVRAAVLAGNAFLDYFRDNRIWLPKPMSENVEQLSGVFIEAWDAYHDPDQQGRFRRKGDAWRRIVKEVPERRSEIEEAMRRVLGTPS
jgi:hypothetical protein